MRHFVATLQFSSQARDAYLTAQADAASAPPSHVELRARHVVYLDELRKTGSLICAGPSPDYQHGVIVLAAENEAGARELLNGDPYMQHGYFEEYNLIEFQRHL